MVGVGVPELTLLLIAIGAAVLGGFMAKVKGRSVLIWSMVCLAIPICALIILVLKPVRRI